VLPSRISAQDGALKKVSPLSLSRFNLPAKITVSPSKLLVLFIALATRMQQVDAHGDSAVSPDECYDCDGFAIFGMVMVAICTIIAARCCAIVAARCCVCLCRPEEEKEDL
jgi:hypothetical protein